MRAGRRMLSEKPSQEGKRRKGALFFAIFSDPTFHRKKTALLQLCRVVFIGHLKKLAFFRYLCSDNLPFTENKSYTLFGV